jgi:hypothetical protein
LAAFLQDLDTDRFDYDPALYRYVVPGSGVGHNLGPAFKDALGLVRRRYGGNYNITSASNLISVFPSPYNRIANLFTSNYVDDFSLRPALTAPYRNTNDLDQTSQPWPGATPPNKFVDVEDLFHDTDGSMANLTNILTRASVGTDQRYLFYRLISQLSTGSQPELKGKINLNYTNDPTQNTSQTSFVDWTPTNFFKTVGQAILRANLITNGFSTNGLIGGTQVATSFSVTNIELYPQNQYNPLVHQLLQMTLNLYDATTNRQTVNGKPVAPPYMPTVLRPWVARAGNRVYIKDWIEETDNTMALAPSASFHNPDLTFPAGNSSATYANGIAPIIGAKKGFPNFNELSIATIVFAERKLQAVSTSASQRPYATNEMYLIGITNAYAVEAWNSYSNAYTRPTTISVEIDSYAILTNRHLNRVWPPAAVSPFQTYSFPPTNITIWPGQPSRLSFAVPLMAVTNFLANSIYLPWRQGQGSSSGNYLLPYNGATERFDRPNLLLNLDLFLVVSNNVRYSAWDTATRRIIDFVTLTNVSTALDIAGILAGQQNGAAPGGAAVNNNLSRFWDPTNNTQTGVPNGILQQLLTSQGQGYQPPTSDPHWDKETALFANFLLKGGGVTMREAPYAATRIFASYVDWQANDPLVHYTVSDLAGASQTNNIAFIDGGLSPLSKVFGNIGLLNTAYAPWGGNPMQPLSTMAGSFVWSTRQDPGVRNSDCWDFPTNGPTMKYPSVGRIGAVHRGTPWQTIYLKSGMLDARDWLVWSGNPWAHPTNDWKLVDLFTTAPNDNAATGLLPVNQPGLASWSAVLSGVDVLTNTPEGLEPIPITPAATAPNPALSPVAVIANSINSLRQTKPGGTFQTVGEMLAAPALTDQSPFLDASLINNQALTTANDEAYERIPRQILSLLRVGQPRFAVYSFGQSLKPAENSLALANPAIFNVCTNYQITGETAYRTVFRVEGNPARPSMVIESHVPLTPE